MTNKEIIADLLKSGKYELERDGWSQLKPEYFIECGFPKSFIDPLITTFVSDGTWKGSLWKDQDKGIIALPFSTYNYDDSGYSYSSGILVYNIDLVNGFSFNGFVSHGVDSANEETAYDVYVYKSKFIDDYFYTISNKYIKVSTIEDTETILDSIDLK